MPNRVQIQIIKDAMDSPEELSDWENEFIDSLAELEDWQDLTEPQIEQLDKIELKLLG